MTEPGSQSNDATMGRIPRGVKIGGYLLIAFGVLGVLMGALKLGSGESGTDLFYTIIDSLAGLVALSGGWLGIRAWAPSKILVPLILALVAAIADVSAYAVYDWTSVTGAVGIIYFASAIPLAAAYRK